MKEDLQQQLEEVEELVIGMDEVSVTIPWKVAKDLLPRVGQLTDMEHRLLQWHLGDAPHKSKRSEKVRNLLEGLRNS